jgi:hypothetical protein
MGKENFTGGTGGTGGENGRYGMAFLRACLCCCVALRYIYIDIKLIDVGWRYPYPPGLFVSTIFATRTPRTPRKIFLPLFFASACVHDAITKVNFKVYNVSLHETPISPIF